MDRHPGGIEHSRKLIELCKLAPKAKVLDMGAGAGGTVHLLRDLGYSAEGIDIEPRGDGVVQGNYLSAPYEDFSFDGIISQCSFYCSGDVPKAISEAARLLKKGGKLAFSDVTEDAVVLEAQLRAAGFRPIYTEDMTDLWREYYLEALWRDENVPQPKGKKIRYALFISERL